MGPPSPRAGHAVDPRVTRTRAAVLDAARSIFNREGWAAVTHLRVAERTGISRATIYRHWPNQNELLRDALTAEDLVGHELTGELRTDLLGELRSLRLALDRTDLALLIVTLVERAEWDREMRSARQEAVERNTKPLRIVLRRGVERGELHPGTDVDLAISQLVGPVFYQRWLHGRSPSTVKLERHVDLFLRANAPSAPGLRGSADWRGLGPSGPAPKAP